MKILPIEKIKEADAYTIKHEPVADIDLMERAASEIFGWLKAKTEPGKTFKIFCGLGNNGGDGFALGRILSEANYLVEIYVIWHANEMSASCKINFDRVKKLNVKIIELSEKDPLPELDKNDIIIDAIFGSGLTRPISGVIAKIIDHINYHKSVIVAIDTPSGLYCDQTNSKHKGSIIKADYTLSFQFPKLGFLFPENDQYVGHWEILPIGLHPDYINAAEVSNIFIESKLCQSIIKPRKKYDHKGIFGHGFLISGSYGKMGAAIIGTKSALKSGAGLITTHIPIKGYDIIQTSVPPGMVSLDEDEEVFSNVPDLTPYNAIAIGPGIGTDEKSTKALKLLIQNTGLPIIFDADAINILGENKTWISFIPPNCIFTPHPKEFERLVGKASDDFERNQMQREFSIKYKAYVILKGAHTAITSPDGSCYFNSTGNPGMATAGSGDVLTGILLGLQAQGYSSKEASIIGVFLHGLAGDIAAEKWGYEALTAGNITHNLGKAFKKITQV